MLSAFAPPVELADDAELPILRAYLKDWAWEVGRFVDGLKPDSLDADVEAVSPGFPVFRITPDASAG